MLYNRFKVGALALFVAAALAACGGDKSPATDSASSSNTPGPASSGQASSGQAASGQAVSNSQAPLYSESEGKAKVVETRIKEKYPNLTPNQVRQLNIPGNTAMFEFMVGPQITYTNEGVDFLLVGGELLSGAGTDTVNVTQKSAGMRLKDAYTSIPLEGAIQYTYGQGQREVVIFSDPDCPYCQALEFMIEQNKDNLNARIAVVPYPIDSLHPDADKKSRYILCTKDPAASWRNWMITSANAVANAAPNTAVADPWPTWASQNPSQAGCARAKLVDQAKEYARAQNFNQTPILMFSNGMPYLGLPTREELEKAWEYVRTNPAP